MDTILSKKIKNIKSRVFVSTSLNSLKSDALKSGVQKYIRRCNLEKALYCTAELDLFKVIKHDRKIRALRSNLRNRLIIILCEDIGISDWRIYTKINKLLKKWEDTRESDSNIDRKYLMEIIHYMANSEKLRITCWLRKYYSSALTVPNLKKYYADGDIEAMKKTSRRCGHKFYRKDDSEEIKNLIDGFVYHFVRNSDNVFYWIFKILNSKDKNGKRCKNTNKGYIIWDILGIYINRTLNVKLFKLYHMHKVWYKKNNNSRNENFLYLLNAVLFYLRRKDIDWTETIDEYNLSNEEVTEIYNRNIGDEYNFEFDDYVIDVHCSQGKRMGKTVKHFITGGGSHVNNESHFAIQKYKKVSEEYVLEHYRQKEKEMRENTMKSKEIIKKLNKKHSVEMYQLKNKN